jgi:hypothetical protein
MSKKGTYWNEPGKPINDILCFRWSSTLPRLGDGAAVHRIKSIKPIPPNFPKRHKFATFQCNY